MELHKIENQIREKLNDRTIQPSAPSWDQLDAMLHSLEKEKEKAKPKYNWFAVAASIVVLVGLGILYTNTPSSSTPIEASIPVASVLNPKNDSVTTTSVKTIIVKKQSPTVVQNNVATTTKLLKETQTQELETNQKIVVQETVTNSPTTNPTTYKYISPEALLNEIQTGQKAISPNRNTIAKNKIKINAATLLTGVEKELDSVYRETTLDKINRNYNKIKTVIANRNFE
jgi:hypothetical protein